MTRVCRQCGELKDVSGFYRGQGQGTCKVCRSARKREMYHASTEKRTKAAAATKLWRVNNPGYHGERYRKCGGYEKHLMRKYGLTLQAYNQMLARQDFQCALCGEEGIALEVDHNHGTEKVRGLLCSGCNKGIGLLRDNSVALERAMHYVSA